MKKHFLLFPLFFLACGVEGQTDFKQLASTEKYEDSVIDPGEQSLPLVDFVLDVGNLQVNGTFNFTSPSVNVGPDFNMVYIQIAAFMIDVDEHNTDLLRVHFQSDYEEWTSFDDIISPVYQTQEECEEESTFCESIDLIYGESGLVESREGLVGLRNAHCRYTGGNYEYEVEAWVETLETYPPTVVSEVEKITIQCSSTGEGE
jgi:hypothetical protein